MAHRRLPAFAAEYIEGGAEEELTLARNRAVFDQFSLAPRVLQSVESADLSTRLFGVPTRLPIVIAPTGFAGLLWRHGDRALANAAARAGVPFTQSIASSARLEDIATTPDLRHWLQLYVFRDRQAVRTIVDRAAASGCEALVVTVDSMTYGKRDWDARGYTRQGALRLELKLEALRHPRWIGGVLRHGIPGFENLYDFLPKGAGFAQSASWARAQVDPALSWDDIAWLRSIWPAKLLAKGIACSADVARALDVGVDAVVLSNHGGRQLDGVLSSARALPPIADAVGGRLAVLVDGGVRSGLDVVRMLALGARGVLLGRAWAFALAGAGQAGVAHLLQLIAAEMRVAMALTGCTSIAAIDRGILAEGRPP